MGNAPTFPLLLRRGLPFPPQLYAKDGGKEHQRICSICPISPIGPIRLILIIFTKRKGRHPIEYRPKQACQRLALSEVDVAQPMPPTRVEHHIYRARNRLARGDGPRYDPQLIAPIFWARNEHIFARNSYAN
jgi:hypothetical protein